MVPFVVYVCVLNAWMLMLYLDLSVRAFRLTANIKTFRSPAEAALPTRSAASSVAPVVNGKHASENGTLPLSIIRGVSEIVAQTFVRWQ